MQPRMGRRAAAAWLVLCVAAACRGTGGPEPAAAPAPRHGGTAVIGSISDIDTWNEYLSRQAFAVDLLRRVYLRLAQPLGDARDRPPTYVPVLAESWTASADGTAITFRLRDARWSDGRPIAPRDVIFTWRAQTSPEVGWVAADAKRRIVAVEDGGDGRTVTFRFDGPYPDQLADAVDGGILPEHVFGAVPFAAWRTHDWSSARVGSGPFLPASHEPAHEIRLARNPAYPSDGPPYVDAVVVRIVPDASNLVTQLLAGALDYVDGVPPREAARVRASGETQLIGYDEPKYDYIGWNGGRPPFDDPRVRRALTLALDRQAIVDDLLYGFGRVSRGPVLSFWWGADREIEPWPYDPAEAERLLAAAGYDRDRRPLAFEITTNAGNRLREAVLVKAQEQWSRIGVRATPAPLEMKTFMAQNMAGDYAAYLGGWRFTGKIELRSIFHSEQVPKRGNNVVRYVSADADRLLDELDRAVTWEGMIAPLRALQRRLHADAPYTFLYETQRLAAAGPRLRGVEIDLPSDPLARLERWWIASPAP